MEELRNSEKQLIKLSLNTRFCVIIIQFLANILIPDHNAGVFVRPVHYEESSLVDKTIKFMFSGFVRWDAHYFLHIARHGYTYENSLAFFPAYPFIIAFLSSILKFILPFINEDSSLILSFLIINCSLFTIATIFLYRLSLIILNKDLAFKSAVFFCINPATIFFVAPYTECLFSFLSFYAMLNFAKLKQQIDKYGELKLHWKLTFYLIPFSLSTCTRSNGLLNLGFILYLFFIVIAKLCINKNISGLFRRLMIYIWACIVSIIISIIPFIYVQIKSYYLFCKDFQLNLPKFLLEHAFENDYLLPGKGSFYNQTWCLKKIPLAYSYVQEHYWNVGFLKYYELKQIPNFLLAVPIIFIICKNSVTFFLQHKQLSVYLGLFNKEILTKNREKCFSQEMFVFVLHGFFLTLFCIFFVHIQVTTRMLCSASPLFYWFCAYYFKNISFISHGNFTLMMFIKHSSLNSAQKFVKYYFLSYFVVGTIMFCNFLPWT